MTTPLSQDLRRRIVRAVERGSSIRQAAVRYEVSPSAAVKLMRRLRQTGSVRPDRVGGHRRPVLEPHQDLLRTLVEGKSGITLSEIQAELQTRGIEVQALSTIHLMLKRMDLTHKKDAPGGRAGQAGCSPGAPPLSGVATVYGCKPLRVPGRDRHRHQHDPALRQGAARAAGRRCGAARALADHHLCGGLARERRYCSTRGGRSDEERDFPRLCRADAGSGTLEG